MGNLNNLNPMASRVGGGSASLNSASPWSPTWGSSSSLSLPKRMNLGDLTSRGGVNRELTFNCLQDDVIEQNSIA
jgi:hypothetical protein